MRGLAVVSLLAFAPAAHAGAWLQPKGEGLVITTVEATTAAWAFGPERRRALDTDFRKYETRAYSEYGLWDGLTLVGQMSLQDVGVEVGDYRVHFQGLSEVRGGARLPVLSKGRHRFSVEASGGYRLGGEFVAGGNLFHSGPTLEARGLYGAGWNRAYLDLQAGYLTRFGKGPDTWLADASVGYTWGRASVSVAASYRSTHDGFLEERKFLLPTDSLKLKAGAAWRIKDGLRVEFARLDTVAGRNHIREAGYAASVWSDF